MARFDFVVSAENTHYMAWQSMLFHFSCVEQNGCAPIVVVHGGDEPLVRGFRRIAEKGGRVQRARNYRLDGGLDYAPRNTAGTLQSVESEADYLVICDPDLVFVRPFEPPEVAPDEVTFERVSYLHVDQRDVELLERAAARAGVDLEALRAGPVSGGIPHVVPSTLREALAADWLACLECFAPDEPPTEPGPQLNWLATMWAVVFAVQRRKWRPVMTDLGVANFKGAEVGGASFVHYCYGDDHFEKRGYVSELDAEERVWRAFVPGGIDAVVCNRLRDAAFYFAVQEKRDSSKLRPSP